MIIFISGSINSGKSTVATVLAEKLGKTAILEIDELRNFIRFMPLEESIPINLENACLLIKNFVKYHINVVAPYPLSQKNCNFITKQLKNLKTKIHFFTLSPSLAVALKRRGERELTEWEINRIKHHYQIAINKPSFGKTIDNTNQTPEETADEILNILNNS